MGKFLCVCDETIRTSGRMPNLVEWLAISDVAFDEFVGQVDSEAIYSAFTHVFVCQRCGSLWVYRDGVGEDPVCFTPLDRDRWPDHEPKALRRSERWVLDAPEMCRCEDVTELWATDALWYANQHLKPDDPTGAGCESFHRCPRTGVRWCADRPRLRHSGVEAMRLRRVG